MAEGLLKRTDSGDRQGTGSNRPSGELWSMSPVYSTGRFLSSFWGVLIGEFFDNLVCVKSGILKNVAGRLPLLGWLVRIRERYHADGFPAEKFRGLA